MKKFTLLTTLILAVLTTTTQIIHVPAEQPTIQAGIDAAIDGDTVLVADGTYLENINFNGKAITLASQFILTDDISHISNTIIDGSEPDNPNNGSVVTFDSGEDTTSILWGFTITGGVGTYVTGYNSWAGGGIYMYPSGGKIMYNIIENNIIETNIDAYGAGLLCDHDDQSWLVLVGNKILNNQCIGQGVALGGGISVFGAARIVNNEVMNNSSLSQFKESSGGIACRGDFYNSDFKEIIVANNIIKNNSAYSNSTNTEGGYNGGLMVEGYYGVVRNNQIANNSVNAGEGLQCYGAGFMSLRNSPDLIVENNRITDNFSTRGKCLGAGICIWSCGGLYQNNVIQNNSGYFGGGVAIVFNDDDDVTAVLTNNTITGNEGVYGGGLHIYKSNGIIINTILWDNEATEEGDGILDLESKLEVRYSNVQGEEEWPGNGNIMIDPGFASDGYHLDWESELVNEGISGMQIGNYWCDAPEYDIDGNERPFDGTDPDIGADEALWHYVQIPESASKETSSLNFSPNPVSSSYATIEYKLDRTSVVQVSLFNQFGEMVEVLVDDHQSKGNYQVDWNFEDLPAGVYFCFLKTISGSQSIKIIKLK